jgi:hypothetical protein
MPEAVPGAELPDQQLGLVVPALPRAAGVQGDGDGEQSATWWPDEVHLGCEQPGQGYGKDPPPLVLETVDRPLKGTLVGHGRAQGGDSPQPGPAGAALSGELELAAAPGTARVAERPDGTGAVVTEPRPELETGAAPRWEEQIEKGAPHAPRMPGEDADAN